MKNQIFTNKEIVDQYKSTPTNRLQMKQEALYKIYHFFVSDNIENQYFHSYFQKAINYDDNFQELENLIYANKSVKNQIRTYRCDIPNKNIIPEARISEGIEDSFVIDNEKRIEYNEKEIKNYFCLG